MFAGIFTNSENVILNFLTLMLVRIDCFIKKHYLFYAVHGEFQNWFLRVAILEIESLSRPQEVVL